MQKFLKQNWHHVMSLIIAFAALILSLQSRSDSIKAIKIASEGNQIAQNANAEARKANIIASEAITLSVEANDIARESNQLIFATVKSEIVAYMDTSTEMMWTVGCREKSDRTLRLYSGVTLFVNLANIGLKPASLVKVEIGDSTHWWNVKSYVDDQQRLLPVVFEPGYRGKWKFEALAIVQADSEQLLQPALEKRRKDDKLRIIATFDDGNTAELTTTSWPAVTLDFEQDCN